MKKIIYFLFILQIATSFAQEVKLKATRLDSIGVKADFFVGFDGFNNCIYLKNNVLFKKIDQSIIQYQNLGLGKITKVDITNPLKIIIFYEEFNSVIVLDNQLNEIQKIEFSRLEQPVLASAIGISGQNKLWVFNSLSQQIGLYDLTTGIYENKSNPLNQPIAFYQTDFNYFHWIDKDKIWYTATIFGRIITNGNVEVSSDLLLLPQNKILFSKDNKLFIRDRNINKLYEIEIVEKTFKKFYYKEQILSIFTNQGITNYKIIIP
ncbi:hypothetical protein [Flavobacterium sp.]|uniref:hypothetical protein n=1 Tax=Flavobacterium sp. TaxID=239 RepID=UPI002618C833|nr:hypothetical protein [Flavobacterium sp.]